MNALALTDHGNLHGALEFYRKAKANDIKPIIGYEAYIAAGSRFQKEMGRTKHGSYHLTLLAANRTGFKNLVKMASAAYLEGFYFKPRIDKELLEQYNEGIICLSGCVSGELSRALLGGGLTSDTDLKEALEISGWFHRIFGNRYYIEIQNNGVQLQRLAMEGSLRVAERLGLPVVATSDAHYADREDAEAQDILLCINTGRFRTDTSRLRMEGCEYYIRGPEDMYAAFPDHADAVARSQEIADLVDIDLELGKRHFPTYSPIPEGKTPEQMLRELCVQGLLERYAGTPQILPSGELAPAVLERLDRELAVINKLGFSNYFLIVWDFVRFARQNDIPATARGSGVGALVCYALYLSHVCPLQYDLLFERFLDESRLEAPDIDIDFCKDGRAAVIGYVKEKYGEDNVAQIGTFGTLQARAAIKDVGRALGIPVARVNEVSSMVPEELGITLEKALARGGDLKATYDSDGEIRELIDLARRIEGLARNVGTHAAAVVIADQPLTEYVPLSRVGGKDDIITQWSMGDVEAAGLLKMDFLGLRNLTILHAAVDLIRQTTGTRIDPFQFPLDDEQTFALLQRGETKGVFQLESGGIRDLLQKMKPDHFRDIIATNALYRPGPLEGGMVDKYVAVKHGRESAEYKHPFLKEILEETHGVMVYQEQVMRILNRLGGIELAKAYTCIKAISKKKESLIAANYERFIEGAMANGLTRKDADEIWNLILKFAGYGFNKSHSTAYALIAYQTAYLKTHYPVEFMATLLSGDIPGRNFKKKDTLVEHMEDCKRMGIDIVPPDVNRSEVDFSVAGGKIHFALSAIKGCGGSSAEAIVASRKKNGPFKDLFDFCERVDPSACHRAAIETLIKAGAFDSLRARRSQLLAVLDRAMQAGAAILADRRSGQKSLFDELDDPLDDARLNALPDLPELDEHQRLQMEKEVLGFYLSSHPLDQHQAQFATYCTHTVNDVADLKDRAEVLIGGMLSSIKYSHVKKPRAGSAATKYAMFDLEDISGSIRCILWPNDFEQFGPLVQPDAILAVRGAVDRRGGDEANLIVNELIPLDQLRSRYTRGILLRVIENKHGCDGLKKLKEILRGYPGDCEVQLMLCLEDGTRVLMKSESLRVDVTAELRARVDDLLGSENIKLLSSQASGVNGKRNGYREHSFADRSA
jgi:DNA polymerase-3 subunit alpha